MEKKSCGAIFYAINNDGELGIILGDESRSESNGWLPFKGGVSSEELDTEAASREIYEETCGLVKIDPSELRLNHVFMTKRKQYYIALVEVPYDIIAKFDEIRKNEHREEFREKRKLGFFKFPDVLGMNHIHSISKASVLFYKTQLENIQVLKSDELRQRCQGISCETAEILKEHVNASGLSPSGASSDSEVEVHVRSKSRPKSKSLPVRLKNPLKREPLREASHNKNRGELLRRPAKYNMSFTPKLEKMLDSKRVWRKELVSY